jgi:hypothetical protein
MILKILLVLIFLFILSKRIESMTCKDIQINDSPVSSIYDVTYNTEKKTYENKKFDEDYMSYKRSLKQYFIDLKKYCTINI